MVATLQCIVMVASHATYQSLWFWKTSALEKMLAYWPLSEDLVSPEKWSDRDIFLNPVLRRNKLHDLTSSEFEAYQSIWFGKTKTREGNSRLCGHIGYYQRYSGSLRSISSGNHPVAPGNFQKKLLEDCRNGLVKDSRNDLLMETLWEILGVASEGKGERGCAPLPACHYFFFLLFQASSIFSQFLKNSLKK